MAVAAEAASVEEEKASPLAPVAVVIVVMEAALGPAPAAAAVTPEAFLGALGTPPSANWLLGEVEEVGDSLSAGEEEEEEGVGDWDSWDSAKECRGSPNPTLLRIPPLPPTPPPPASAPPTVVDGGRMNPVLWCVDAPRGASCCCCCWWWW